MGRFTVKLLLDTHIWLWWINQSEELSPAHTQIIENADSVFVSAISCWEIMLLVQRQRIQLPLEPSEWFRLGLSSSGIACLPLTHAIAVHAALLESAHRDPADRFIIATALEHHLNLMSFDTQFPQFDLLSPYLLGRNLS